MSLEDHVLGLSTPNALMQMAIGKKEEQVNET